MEVVNGQRGSQSGWRTAASQWQGEVVLRFGKESATLTKAGKGYLRHLCAESIFGCQSHEGRVGADSLRATVSV
jgi:hypothetical protein